MSETRNVAPPKSPTMPPNGGIGAVYAIPRLSVIAAISVVGSMVAMKTEPSADWRKEVGLT